MGVVTSMLFQLSAVEGSGQVYGGQLVFPIEWGKETLKAKTIYETWMSVADGLPPNAHITACLATPPPEERPALAGRPIHKPHWGSKVTMQENSNKYAYSHPCLVLTCIYNGPVDEVGTSIFR